MVPSLTEMGETKTSRRIKETVYSSSLTKLLPGPTPVSEWVQHSSGSIRRPPPHAPGTGRVIPDVHPEYTSLGLSRGSSRRRRKRPWRTGRRRVVYGRVTGDVVTKSIKDPFACSFRDEKLADRRPPQRKGDLLVLALNGESGSKTETQGTTGH